MEEAKQFIDTCIRIQGTSQIKEERLEAEANLETAWENPESILILLDLIENPLDPQSPFRAIAMLNRAIARSNELEHLGDQEVYQIILKLMELALGAEQPLLDSLAMTLESLIELFKLTQIDDLFDNVIVPVWQTRAFQAVIILMHIVGDLSMDLIERQAQILFEMVSQAIQVDNWDAKIAAVKVFFMIIPSWLGKVDVTPVLEHIVNLTGEITKSAASGEQIAAFWTELIDPIEQGCFPEDYLAPMFETAMAVATNTDYDCFVRYKPLSAMIKVLPMLNAETFSGVMDLTITMAMEYTELSDGEILPAEFMEPISVGFDRLPADAVYELMKEKMTQLMAMDAIPPLTVLISIVTIILRCAPETVYRDTEWLMDILVKGFQSNNPLLMQAVCQALEAFEDTMTSITKYAPIFIEMMIPALVCEHEDLRHCAYDAFESLLKVMDTEIPGLFEALWNIKDNVFENDFCNFVPFLAEAIEKSKAIGDEEIGTLLEFIRPHYNVEEEAFDIERAVCLLTIVGALITNVDALGDQVAEIVEPVIDVVLSTPTIYDLYIVREVLHYIETVYSIYGPGANNYYGARIEFLVNMALQNDEIEVLQGIDPALVCDAFTCCCAIAKATQSSEIAQAIEERCTVNLEWDDELVEESLEYTKDIIKLLPVDRTAGIFRNFSDFIVDTVNPALVQRAVKIVEKCLSGCGPENRAPFLEGCCAIVEKFIQGGLECLNGVQPTEGKCDHYVMCAMLSLITKICKFAPKGPIVDDLCQFAMSMMSPDNAALFSIIGLLSEAVRSETCSEEMFQQILEKIQEFMPVADDPSVKQNIAWTIKVIIEKHPESTANFAETIPLFCGWMNEAIENPAGNQESLANIASLILQYAANGGELEEQVIVMSVIQLPAYDEQETVPMVMNMMTLLDRGVSAEIMKACILAVCELLLLNDGEKINHDLTPEIIGNLSQWLANMRAVDGVEGIIAEKYANSNSSIVKLNQFMPA